MASLKHPFVEELLTEEIPNALGSRGPGPVSPEAQSWGAPDVHSKNGSQLRADGLSRPSPQAGRREDPGVLASRTESHPNTQPALTLAMPGPAHVTPALPHSVPPALVSKARPRGHQQAGLSGHFQPRSLWCPKPTRTLGPVADTGAHTSCGSREQTSPPWKDWGPRWPLPCHRRYHSPHAPRGRYIPKFSPTPTQPMWGGRGLGGMQWGQEAHGPGPQANTGQSRGSQGAAHKPEAHGGVVPPTGSPARAVGRAPGHDDSSHTRLGPQQVLEAPAGTGWDSGRSSPTLAPYCTGPTGLACWSRIGAH